MCCHCPWLQLSTVTLANAIWLHMNNVIHMTMSQRDSDQRRTWGLDNNEIHTYWQHTHTHTAAPDSNTVPGRAKMSLRVPSMSTVAKVVGRLKKRNTQVWYYHSNMTVHDLPFSGSICNSSRSSSTSTINSNIVNVPAICSRSTKISPNRSMK